MKMALACALLSLFPPASAVSGHAQVPPRGMVRIAAGSFQALYAQDGRKQVHVREFAFDREPVNASSFAAFVARNPVWSKQQVTAKFADTRYDDQTSHATSTQPATRIS